MGKLTALIKKLYYDKRIRFLFVGGLNTAIGYGAYALFTYLGLHYVLAHTFSTIIGVIHSYFWNKYFTFTQKKKSFNEAIRFVCVYAISFFLSLGLQYILIDLHDVNQYISGLIGLVITTLLSYFGHNFFSFRQKNLKNTDENKGNIENNINENGRNINIIEGNINETESAAGVVLREAENIEELASEDLKDETNNQKSEGL